MEMTKIKQNNKYLQKKHSVKSNGLTLYSTTGEMDKYNEAIKNFCKKHNIDETEYESQT